MIPLYNINIHEDSLRNITKYQDDLKNNKLQAGAFLAKKIKDTGVKVSDLRTDEFIELLLSTKKPKFFAESAIQGAQYDWNNNELRLLGDINVTVSTKIYDNCVWKPDDNQFKQHDVPLEGELLFTPGVLLRGDSFPGVTPDREDVTTDSKGEQIDQEKYNKLVERRLLPMLAHANKNAGPGGALVTMPGLGCGAFAGEFQGQMGGHLDKAIEAMLRKHTSKFPNIKGVYFANYDPNLGAKQSKIGNIQYIVSKNTIQNPDTHQLGVPSDLSSNFKDCRLFKMVAWDHVSLPGNDYFVGSRWTDDGVAAAATNSMQQITGVAGKYNKQTGRYDPPSGYTNWKAVVDQNRVHLQARSNNIIITENNGISSSLGEFASKKQGYSVSQKEFGDSTGFKGTELIKSLPDFKDVEIINKRYGVSNDYMLQCNSKAEAESLSELLGREYNIKGSSGKDKYVSQFLKTGGDNRYGIVLTDANVESLNQKITKQKQDENLKAVQNKSDVVITQDKAKSILQSYLSPFLVVGKQATSQYVNTGNGMEYAFNQNYSKNINSALDAIANGRNFAPEYRDDAEEKTAEFNGPQQYLRNFAADKSLDDINAYVDTCLKDFDLEYKRKIKGSFMDLINVITALSQGQEVSLDIPSASQSIKEEDTGFKSTELIKSLPDFKDVEIINKRYGVSNDYMLQCNSKAEAESLSELLGREYNIKGSSGKDKYVSQFLKTGGDNRYGIILTDANVESLNQKITKQKQDEIKHDSNLSTHSQVEKNKQFQGMLSSSFMKFLSQQISLPKAKQDSEGFKDTTLIEGAVDFKGIEIVRGYDDFDDNNYMLQCNSKAEAESLSKLLGHEYNIKGSSGKDKYVSQFLKTGGDNRYGIVLTDANVESLNQKIKAMNVSKSKAAVSSSLKAPDKSKGGYGR